MKTIYKPVLSILSLILLTTSCNEKETHFLTDATYRQQVHEQFLKRQDEAKHRNEVLFSILERESLSLEQKEALEFLYAYMPLCDLADYNGDFFLKQVDAAFNARDYFHWGKTIPEDIFRHFVLVYRVNNEYLDTARLVFFEELKERIKDMTMEEAALEVNHWCHEKVTYRATDGRTSAPLALVRTSWGRCGEESTFTATALRAVGIPARQCYTPRWAHTNSNHAWVEVWINGQWHYMGACEPEPELNVAWFTAPAKRGMMVHTNVFGLYTGPEEKNFESPLYSRINLLANYAPTRQVKVKVIDEKGQPVSDATVKFNVYNYSELYPITESMTNADGLTSITSGMGDLLIWVNKDDLSGYKKSSPEDEMVTITIENSSGKIFDETFTMNPPQEQKIKELSSEKIAANTIRLAYEDSIRNAYMNTFATESYACELAEKMKSNKNEMWKYLQLAQGNWREIEAFIKDNKDNPRLFPFLSSLLEKDLRDTPSEYLNDHIQNGGKSSSGIPEDIFVTKILSPRIALELIKPWRSFFQQKTIAEEIAGTNPSVNHIIDYIERNIQIKNEENYYNCLITPRGVYELKIADSRSRDVFFVAVCRSLSIAAQVDEATGKPQYYQNGKWNDVIFDKESTIEKSDISKAKLTLSNAKTNVIKPEYSTHYTLAYFKEGDFRTLNYRNNPVLATYPSTLDLDEGYYRLITGSRANDGSVTVHSDYFELKQGKPHSITLQLPEIVGKIFVQGSIDMNTVVTLENNDKKSLKELANGKGLMLCFVDVGKEPSKHILQDLPQQQSALERWNGGILLVTPDDKLNNAFHASAFRNLPKQTTWGVDNQRALLKTVAETLQINFNDNFPLTIYLSTNGGILYYSVGYRIGIGEDILKTIHLEKESLISK